jgi:hypothetical protein
MALGVLDAVFKVAFTFAQKAFLKTNVPLNITIRNLIC